MEGLIIIIESQKQKTKLQINYEFRMIEEFVTYFQEDGKVFKTVLETEKYSDDINLGCIRMFFNSRLNSLLRFYQSEGEFKIKLM